MLGLSLIVCRNKQGKYLAVNESRNRGWWLPGGRVDPPESFHEAAIRETLEEAGIHVELKGVLRIEYNISELQNYQRLKVIFYAEPLYENEKPKDKADKESLEGRWVTIEELIQLQKEKPGWRGPELHDWAEYIEKGGVIQPLSTLEKESSQIKQGKSFTVKELPLNK